MSRIVFLGTPAAALPSLEAVAATGELACVVSRPARPSGRRRTMTDPPVAIRAREMGVPLIQPASKSELDQQFPEADLAVIVAFGMIILPDLLARPPHGFVNVHFSMLPRWRGAAPVERAIEAGDRTTGVTLMRIDEGLDTGPIVAQLATSIGADETAGELLERLAIAGGELLATHLPALRSRPAVTTPQPEDGVTHARMIHSDDAHIGVTDATTTIAAAIRAFNPRPGAFGLLDGERFKIWRAEPGPHVVGDPGRMIMSDDRVLLVTGDGSLNLLEVQPAGSKRMSAIAWARGAGADPGRLT